MGTTPVTPVALIGMACRLPGGINSAEQLWDALLRGSDMVTEIPPDRRRACCEKLAPAEAT